ncbi:outer membrane protein [Filimonas lacunae]|nr:outer membrane protein [Filimonas lacunae]
MKHAIKEIEKQAHVLFFYNEQDLGYGKPVTVRLSGVDLPVALEAVFKEQPLTYKIIEQTVAIKRKDGVLKQYNGLEGSDSVLLTGTVVDSVGNGIAGAVVAVRSSNVKAITSSDGRFVMKQVLMKGDYIDVGSMGYYPASVLYGAQKNILVKLRDSVSRISDVVVTGMMTFNRKTFSGATATYTGQDLKMIANTNVVAALKSLDPSFLLQENNAQGSNPNVLPTINLRGTTSITSSSLQNEFSNDVNQPLLILDNFETDLRTVMNLDMNRLASITILKDAASTAIYGSRASNGVIVIETVKPKADKVRMSYNTDWNFDFPDLSGYNMMNAAEKLQFEQLAGVYGSPTSTLFLQSSYYDPMYTKHLQDVQRGVNTYWLSTPLQTATSQRHSLYVEGGTGTLLFNAGGSYKKANGVMIGSGNDEWTARINTTYRTAKLSVNNNLSINGYNATESPYDSFRTWVNTNPYYTRTSADSMYLWRYGSNKIVNPLYNSSINNFDKSKRWGITNNLQMNYTLSKSFRLQGNVQVSKNVSGTDDFTSPRHTKYADVNYLKKGSYRFYQANNFSYTGNAMLSYARTFRKHMVNVNTRVEISNTENSSNSFTAVGFPTSSNGKLSQAYGYAEGSSPGYVKSVTRRNSFVNTASYSYDMRYAIDVAFNYDGSTAFGKNNVYSPFYSIGASWNLGNEKIVQQLGWINLLRLRANYGVTGNQGFSSYTSITTYSYMDSYNYSGGGVAVSSLGNPDLKWQTTYQTSIGIDAGFMKGRMSINLNGYRKLTDPLVVSINVPTSNGVAIRPQNAGRLNVKGIDGTVSYAPVYQPQQGISWFIRLTGSYYTQQYSHFGNLLKSLNDTLYSTGSLQRYKDGYAPDDIWAVQSLGIDPATGSEVFLKKDGKTRTFDYRSADIVKVGNSRPLLQGTITNSVLWKGFSVSLVFRYLYHQDQMNTALYDKVENLSLSDVINNNVDKRALYSRWKKPGDQSQFKAISLTSTTPISSRFIQRENTLSLESCSMGYDFSRTRWVTGSALFSSIRVTGYMNDIFRLSTIRRERGIDYPYARSVSLSVSATFK